MGNACFCLETDDYGSSFEDKDGRNERHQTLQCMEVVGGGVMPGDELKILCGQIVQR